MAASQATPYREPACARFRASSARRVPSTMFASFSYATSQLRGLDEVRVDVDDAEPNVGRVLVVGEEEERLVPRPVGPVGAELVRVAVRELELELEAVVE